MITGLSIYFLVSVIKATRRQKGRWGINLDQNTCPRCNEELPRIRLPRSLEQFMWGGATCRSCGCEIDKWGKDHEKVDGQDGHE